MYDGIPEENWASLGRKRGNEQTDNASGRADLYGDEENLCEAAYHFIGRESFDSG